MPARRLNPRILHAVRRAASQCPANIRSRSVCFCQIPKGRQTRPAAAGGSRAQDHGEQRNSQGSIGENGRTTLRHGRSAWPILGSRSRRERLGRAADAAFISVTRTNICLSSRPLWSNARAPSFAKGIACVRLSKAKQARNASTASSDWVAICLHLPPVCRRRSTE